ncbi:CLUMA_CG021631, isoform A [Clunio marinus]|uniref:CLUMA_CG021631, isoform A n=1 Tax=Clunio marinus TaxID=568069 RepID=A0A1J1JC92_9DIPT|nr:CLUMA_CG021631, isoform A [Clunio marinus]
MIKVNAKLFRQTNTKSKFSSKVKTNHERLFHETKYLSSYLSSKYLAVVSSEFYDFAQLKVQSFVIKLFPSHKFV